jgi:hypothetical protein
MTAALRLLPLLAASSVILACSDSARARDTVASARCPVTSANLRIDSGLVGGVSTDLPIRDLQRMCPSARTDTVGVGGTQPIALSIAVPGAVVSAIQTKYEAYGDSLHRAEPADLWVARGDSLRFPDGALIPTRVGALRRLDSVAVILVDHGDDGTGSYVVRCKYPRIALVISNGWPTFPDTGVIPFTKVVPSDTTELWRVEVGAYPTDERIIRACSKLRDT